MSKSTTTDLSPCAPAPAPGDAHISAVVRRVTLSLVLRSCGGQAKLGVLRRCDLLYRSYTLHGRRARTTPGPFGARQGTIAAAGCGPRAGRCRGCRRRLQSSSSGISSRSRLREGRVREDAGNGLLSRHEDRQVCLCCCRGFGLGVEVKTCMRNNRKCLAKEVDNKEHISDNTTAGRWL